VQARRIRHGRHASRRGQLLGRASQPLWRPRAARRNLEAYEREEIDYPEFMRRDIALWQPAPTIDEVRAILSSYSLAPNVRKVVEEVHQKGYQTAIITGGLDILANEVARELGIAHVLAKPTADTFLCLNYQIEKINWEIYPYVCGFRSLRKLIMPLNSSDLEGSIFATAISSPSPHSITTFPYGSTTLLCPK